MITSLKSDIKTILEISFTYDGVNLLSMIGGNFNVIERISVDSIHNELKSFITARNVEDGEEYIVEFERYQHFWILRLENGDEFLIFRV